MNNRYLRDVDVDLSNLNFSIWLNRIKAVIFHKSNQLVIFSSDMCDMIIQLIYVIQDNIKK